MKNYIRWYSLIKKTPIEVGIINLYFLTQVENEAKYDILTDELALSYDCTVKIIPYVMTIICYKKYHKKQGDEIGISSKTDAFIQSLVLKKTYISFDRRLVIEDRDFI